MTRSPAVIPAIAAFLLLVSLAAPAAADGTPHQRRLYQAALRALEHKDLAAFRKLRRQLDGYVLAGYLDYEYLKPRIADTPHARIRKFIAANHAAPISTWMRKRWLKDLARRGDWTTFLREYRDIRGATRLQCLYLRETIKRKPDWKQLQPTIRALWRVGRSQPAACDPVFAAWHRHGGLTRDLVWDRIELAMDRGQLGLARHLSNGYLDPQDRIWVTRWQAIHRRPQRELASINYPLKRPVAWMVAKHGVLRLGRKDPELAMRYWLDIARRHGAGERDYLDVFRGLGLKAATRHLPVAVEWLAQVPAEPDDEKLRQWRLRAALRAGRWDLAGLFVGALTEAEQQQSQWRYFMARVYEQTGQRQPAHQLYRQLARERSYYGFLAADRLGSPYAMQYRRVSVPEKVLTAFAARPGVRMAHELLRLGGTIAARRQWAWTIRDLDKRELQAAALLASRWGWHDRAILTIAKAGHYDDLDLRFPILHRQLVEKNAERANIDPSWVLGVVRQESAFIPDARSRAGALGLMQLMPATGRRVGRAINLKIRNRYSILNVENNIRLGTSYLRTVLNRLGGNQVLATAAYNAGPHRVDRWLPDTHAMDADLWVETIPFNETRRYVRNVMGFSTIYNHRLGRESVRLSERMRAIAPRSKGS